MPFRTVRRYAEALRQSAELMAAEVEQGAGASKAQLVIETGRARQTQHSAAAGAVVELGWVAVAHQHNLVVSKDIEE